MEFIYKTSPNFCVVIYFHFNVCAFDMLCFVNITSDIRSFFQRTNASQATEGPKASVYIGKRTRGRLRQTCTLKSITSFLHSAAKTFGSTREVKQYKSSDVRDETQPTLFPEENGLKSGGLE